MSKCKRVLAFVLGLVIFSTVMPFTVLAVKKQRPTNEVEILGWGGGGTFCYPSPSPLDPDFHLATTDMGMIFVSYDAGANWNKLALATTFFTFDLNNENVFYAGSSLGLFRSVDKGKTLERILPREDNSIPMYRGDHADLWYAPLNYDPNDLDARGYPNASPPDGFPYRSEVWKMAVDPEDSNKLYAVVNRFEGQNAGVLVQDYLFYSPDYGQTWSIIAEDLTTYNQAPGYPLNTIPAINTAVREKVQVLVDTTSDPDNRDVLVFHTNGVIKVNTGTGNIETVSQTAYSQVDWLYDKTTKTTTYYLLSSNQMYKTTNTADMNRESGTMSLINKGFSGNISNFGVSSDQVFWANQGANFFRTMDAGATWTQVLTGNDRTNPAKYTSGWMEPAIADGGRGANLNAHSYSGGYGFGVSKADPGVCYGTTSYIIYSTHDGGATWGQNYTRKKPDGGWVSTGADNTTVYGLVWDPFDSNHVFAILSDNGVMKSYDGGESWYPITYGKDGIHDKSPWVRANWGNTCYSMVFDPEVEGRVWSVWSYHHDMPKLKMLNERMATNIGGGGGVAISNDGGETWEPMNNSIMLNLPGVAYGASSGYSNAPSGVLATDIALDLNSPVDSRTLYMATFGMGVWKSTDGGYTWEQKNDGIIPKTDGKRQDGVTPITGPKHPLAGANIAAWDPDYAYFAWQLMLTPGGDLYLSYGRIGSEFVGENSGALYVSRDGAESWEELPMPGDAAHRVNFVNGFDYDPHDPLTIYAACWQSTNGQPNIVRCAPGDERPNSGGVYVSNDGGYTWRLLWGEDKYVFDVLVDRFDSNVIYAVTWRAGAMVSFDKGATWEQIDWYEFDAGYRPMNDPLNPNMLYICGMGGGVWHGPVVKPARFAPAIDGPISMELIEGYEAVSTDAYVITGTEPVNLTVTGDTDFIIWNGTAKTLEIIEGLSAGTYTVTLTACNGVGDDPTITFTLTVNPKTVVYTVNFIIDDQIHSQVTVEEGQTIEQPSDPIKSGYDFNGWRADSVDGEVYDFDTPVTANVALYAAWVKAESEAVNIDKDLAKVLINQPNTIKITSNSHSKDAEAMGIIFEWAAKQKSNARLSVNYLPNGSYYEFDLLIQSSGTYKLKHVFSPGVYDIFDDAKNINMVYICNPVLMGADTAETDMASSEKIGEPVADGEDNAIVQSQEDVE